VAIGLAVVDDTTKAQQEEELPCNKKQISPTVSVLDSERCILPGLFVPRQAVSLCTTMRLAAFFIANDSIVLTARKLRCIGM
jgi:hypothetical protein